MKFVEQSTARLKRINHGHVGIYVSSSNFYGMSCRDNFVKISIRSRTRVNKFLGDSGRFFSTSLYIFKYIFSF